MRAMKSCPSAPPSEKFMPPTMAVLPSMATSLAWARVLARPSQRGPAGSKAIGNLR
ncbi:hypothetical protein D3C72_2015620 [compost metagenome]